ncbi:MAG: hypothetical protein AAB799_00335 [Patescibacteria group bacterium]
MKKIRLVLALVVIIVVGLLIQKFWPTSDIKAYEFTGSIEKVEGQTMYMRGNYNVADHPELRDNGRSFDAKIKVKSDTKFVRINIYRPADLGAKLAAGEAVDPSTFRREVKSGSLEDLKSGMVKEAVIETSKSIYGKESFSAQSVTYYYPVDEEETK